MKKTLFLLLSFVAAASAVNAQETDLSTLTDAVYVQGQSAPAGSQQTLSVCMKNSISVQTIQFDLYLPEGLSFVANEDEELMTASKARINKFNYFESSIQTDGALRLLAQATSTNIPVGDGEIATVIVNVDGAMEPGDYPAAGSSDGRRRPREAHHQGGGVEHALPALRHDGGTAEGGLRQRRAAARLRRL